MKPKAFHVKSHKSGVTYYLHSRKSPNSENLLYFFAKEVKEGFVEHLPAGYELSENAITGLPVLKKIKPVPSVAVVA